MKRARFDDLGLPPVLLAAVLLLILCILLTQGTLLFLDARRRGNKAWFWGIWGMVQFPWPTIAYVFLLWLKKRRDSSNREPKED